MATCNDVFHAGVSRQRRAAGFCSCHPIVSACRQLPNSCFSASLLCTQSSGAEKIGAPSEPNPTIFFFQRKTGYFVEFSSPVAREKPLFHPRHLLSSSPLPSPCLALSFSLPCFLRRQLLQAARPSCGLLAKRQSPLSKFAIIS